MTPIAPTTVSEPTVMRSGDGHALPLVRVDIDARAHGLTHEVTFRQHWKNVGERDIEAIYSFPLPSSAVLLGLRVELAGRELHGVVVARQQAEERYEEAVAQGDSAVLLERSGEGLYTVSLGNVKAGETAVVEVRYAQWLTFDGARLRLSIPTVIAPRYGDAAAAGLPGHAIPETNLAADYPVSVRLRLAGELAAATVSCPTHKAGFHVEAEELVVTLSGAMDRDIVILVDDVRVEQLCVVAANDGAATGDSVASVGTEGRGAASVEGSHVIVAGFTPPRTDGPSTALRLKVLVDCSGSMNGDSIETAKRALARILAGCEARDTISLARFGSQYEAGAPFGPWTRTVCAAATRWLHAMRADMGGTEMVPALTRVFSSGGTDAGNADVLLITDGEIWAGEDLLAAARRADQRVFVIAVGAAPAEGFLTRLARETGGAIEFVTPGEDLAHAIESVGVRLRQPRARDVRVSWPTKPTWELPVPGAIFGGDTVYLVAGFGQVPAGSVELAWTDATEQHLTVSIPGIVAENDTIARLAAARRCDTLPKAEQAAFAARHQLVTDATSMVLVLERADADKTAADLHTIKVPQMLAAGWGGMGTVESSYRGMDAPAVLRRPQASVTLQMSECFEQVAVEPRRRDFGSRVSKSVAGFIERTPGMTPTPGISVPRPTDVKREVAVRLARLGIAAAGDAPTLEGFAWTLAASLRNRGSQQPMQIADLLAFEDAMPIALSNGLLFFEEIGLDVPELVAALLSELARRYPGAGLPASACVVPEDAERVNAEERFRLEKAVRALVKLCGEVDCTEWPLRSDSNVPGRTSRLRGQR